MARHRLAAAVLALSTAVAATGCSGEDSAAGEDASGSATPSPSVTAPVAPAPTEAAAPETPEPPEPPEPPKAADTRAGKKAFARHVLGTWEYALRNNDPRPLTGLSRGKKACGGCRQLRSELREREQQGWYVDLPPVEIEKTTVENIGGASLATMSVAIPESDSYNEDGSYRSTNPAHPDATFEVEMRHRKRGFELVGFRVG